MKYRLYLLVFTFIISTKSFSSDTKFSSSKNEYFIEEQKSKDSIQNIEILTLKNSIKNYETKESLFSNQITILTAIFSTIVAISIFLIGYLIPRLSNKKYKNELKKLLNQFKSIRDEIQLSRKETAKLEAQYNCSTSKIMFFSCVDSKQKNGEILWALRHAKDIYSQFELSENDDAEFFITRALDAVAELEKEKNLKDNVDEINTLTNELIEIYSDSIEGIKEKLNSIKEEYNKIAWSEDN